MAMLRPRPPASDPPKIGRAPVATGAPEHAPQPKDVTPHVYVPRAGGIPEAEFYRRRCADLRDELEFFVAASNEDRAEVIRLRAELAEAHRERDAALLQARGADEYWRLETARANKEHKTAVSIAARYSRALEVIRQLSPKQ